MSAYVQELLRAERAQAQRADEAEAVVVARDATIDDLRYALLNCSWDRGRCWCPRGEHQAVNGWCDAAREAMSRSLPAPPPQPGSGGER